VEIRVTKSSEAISSWWEFLENAENIVLKYCKYFTRVPLVQRDLCRSVINITINFSRKEEHDEKNIYLIFFSELLQVTNVIIKFIERMFI
jgi:hypothetical protein